MVRKYSRWKRYFVMNSLEVNNQHVDEWKHGSGCFMHAQNADRMLTVLCFQPQCSSVNGSSEDDYGICQLIILFPGDQSPFISLKMTLLHMHASLGL